VGIRGNKWKIPGRPLGDVDFQIPLKLEAARGGLARWRCCLLVKDHFRVYSSFTAKESDLYGDWVGLSDDDLNFYRLRLEKDNKGCLATTFNDDREVDLYRINSWGILNGSLTIQLIPMTKGAEDLEITNIRRKVHSLKCTIGSPSGSWSRSAVLYQEKHVSKASSKTKSAMNARGN
jgi:hypothetical protein